MSRTLPHRLSFPGRGNGFFKGMGLGFSQGISSGDTRYFVAKSEMLLQRKGVGGIQ